ncbi:MAG: hypothetical protein LQ348_003019 [Seirophora lacunosa]|nr:MAG: hypothetical protein LQ348_003019 [Seirophora lacunosa]
MVSKLSSPTLAPIDKPEDMDYEEKVEEGSDVLQPIDPALQQRITRKFDTHIIPWLFAIWLLAFIDRSNIGNARIDGLADDLKLDGDKFNIALTVFYIPYVLVDVPSNWLVKYFGANYYLPGLLIAWGIVGMCTGFVTDYNGLLACRFFLGLCEGGLLGGMILYLSMFYRRHELLFRIGMFYCAAPLSGAFGGLLATGLARIHYAGYNRWPWIFIVEGAVTVAYGLVVIFFLPPTPSRARTFFVAAGVFPSSPAAMGWLANNLAPHYVRGTGTGWQIAIGNCSAFVATFTYLRRDAPEYRTGHAINIGFLVSSLCLTTINILYAKQENRKRDKGERDHRLTEGDEGMLGSRHPSFRYTI